jgi:hypothetical protein
MEEEFYASVKLVSGEEIFTLVCATEENENTFLILENPVIMKPMISKQKIYAFKISPWMNIPEDEIYIISIDKVITMTEVRDKNIIGIYKKYLNNNSQIKVDNITGFISKVNDARVSLENLYNS